MKRMYRMVREGEGEPEFRDVEGYRWFRATIMDGDLERVLDIDLDEMLSMMAKEYKRTKNINFARAALRLARSEPVPDVPPDWVLDALATEGNAAWHSEEVRHWGEAIARGFWVMDRVENQGQSPKAAAKYLAHEGGSTSTYQRAYKFFLDRFEVARMEGSRSDET
jgi:hypothetical protein